MRAGLPMHPTQSVDTPGESFGKETGVPYSAGYNLYANVWANVRVYSTYTQEKKQLKSCK
jgi:hypothetical protein